MNEEKKRKKTTWKFFFLLPFSQGQLADPRCRWVLFVGNTIRGRVIVAHLLQLLRQLGVADSAVLLLLLHHRLLLRLGLGHIVVARVKVLVPALQTQFPLEDIARCGGQIRVLATEFGQSGLFVVGLGGGQAGGTGVHRCG